MFCEMARAASIIRSLWQNQSRDNSRHLEEQHLGYTNQPYSQGNETPAYCRKQGGRCIINDRSSKMKQH